MLAALSNLLLADHHRHRQAATMLDHHHRAHVLVPQLAGGIEQPILGTQVTTALVSLDPWPSERRAGNAGRGERQCRGARRRGG